MPPCDSCGTPLTPDAAYCSRCGTRAGLGSVLGVGTDLPPVPDPVRVRGPQGPDLGRTAELPRVDPGAVAATHPVPRTPSHSRASIAAMVATFLVLTVIGTFALVRLTGPTSPSVAAGDAGDVGAAGAPTGPPAPTAPTGTPPSEGQAADPSSAPSSDPSAPSPRATPSASSSVEVSPSPTRAPTPVTPVDAKRCSRSGDDAVATAYAGTDRTSCAFAGAVRSAYRKAGTPGDATSLRAFSPVTKQWYSLSCDGGEPVRCTTTTGAVVVLTAA